MQYGFLGHSGLEQGLYKAMWSWPRGQKPIVYGVQGMRLGRCFFFPEFRDVGCGISGLDYGP